LLIDGLSDPSEDLQEACAHALGSFQDNESAQHLLSLFRGERADRVVASGADAAARLGRLEAAWEILPRMQETTNAVLRSQLAIALGNLLGRPGEFYQYVTAGGTRAASQTQKLFQLVRSRLSSLARQAARESARPQDSGSSRDDTDRTALLQRARELQELFQEGESCRALSVACDMCADIVRLIVRRRPDRPPDTEVRLLVPDAYSIDQRFGLWVWCVAEMQEKDASRKPEACRIEVLLLLYFLASRRLPG
jgi:hypothetical protein